MNKVFVGAVAAFALVALPTMAHATGTESVTAAWVLPADYVHDPEVNPNDQVWGHHLFPQTLAPADPGCGMWLQMDTYRYAEKADIIRVDTLLDGGVLAIVDGNPDDSGLHVENAYTPETRTGWWFEWTGDCVDEPEEPIEPEVPAEPETPVVVEPEAPATTPPAQPEKNELANTGGMSRAWLALPIVGLLAAGAAAFRLGRRSS